MSDFRTALAIWKKRRALLTAQALLRAAMFAPASQHSAAITCNTVKMQDWTCKYKITTSIKDTHTHAHCWITVVQIAQMDRSLTMCDRPPGLHSDVCVCVRLVMMSSMPIWPRHWHQMKIIRFKCVSVLPTPRGTFTQALGTMRSWTQSTLCVSHFYPPGIFVI